MGSSPARRDALVVLLLLLLGAVHIAAVQRLENHIYDSSVYIVLARNILETGRYEFNFEPHTVYPPGLPVILAGVSLLTGRSGYDAYIRFISAFGTLGLVAWYFVLRRDAGRLASAAACLLMATSGPLFEMFTRDVFSDAPYFLLSGLALCCLLRLEQPAAQRSGYFLVAGVGLLTVAAALVRSAGVALSAAMLAWGLDAAWRRSKSSSLVMRAALLGGVAGLLAFAAWVGWSKSAERRDYEGEHMQSYASQFVTKDPHQPELGRASLGDMVLRMASNLPLQWSYIVAIYTRLPYVAALWFSPLIVVPLALLLVGSAACLYGHRGAVLAWYFLTYFAVYLLWPFDEGPRFMAPIAPLAFVLTWRGAVTAGCAVWSRPRTSAKVAAVAAMALAAGAIAIGPQDGAQARLSAAAWTVTALLLVFSILLARRAGPGAFAAVRRLFARSASWPIGPALIAALAILGLFRQARLARANLAPDPTRFGRHASADAAAWLRTAGEGVVMAQQFAIIHQLTGRKVVNFPITSDPRTILEVARKTRTRYLVVVDRVKTDYFSPAEEDRCLWLQRAYPQALQLVHRGPYYRIFEFQSNAGEPAPE
jgi:hypothetical protein